MPEQQQLEIVIKAVDEASKILQQVSGNVQKTEHATGQLGATSEKGGFSIGKMAAAVGLGNIAFTAYNTVMNSAKGFITGSIDQFKTHELAVARLTAGMKNLGGQWEGSRDSLVQYADQLQKTTTFDNDQVVSSAAMLATYRLNASQIKQLTPSILDMATSLQKTTGGTADLQEISIQLGKAIGGEDTAGLYKSLQRVGVMFNKHQEELLKTGDRQTRLNTIVNVISDNFGGSAAEKAHSYTGKIEMMQNAVADVQKMIGEKLVTVLGTLAQTMTSFVTSDRFQAFMKGLLKTIDTLVTGFQTYVVPVIQDQVIPAFNSWRDAIKPFEPLIIGVLKLLGGVAGTALIGSLVVLGKVLEISAGLWYAMKAGIDAVQKSIESVVGWFIKALEKMKAFKDNTVGAIGGATNNVGDFFKNLFKAEGGPISGGRPYIVGERGPELIVPSSSGTVIPNNQLGGSSNVTVNIQGSVTDGNLQSIISEIQRALGRRNELAMKGAI